MMMFGPVPICAPYLASVYVVILCSSFWSNGCVLPAESNDHGYGIQISLNRWWHNSVAAGSLVFLLRSSLSHTFPSSFVSPFRFEYPTVHSESLTRLKLENQQHFHSSSDEASQEHCACRRAYWSTEVTAGLRMPTQGGCYNNLKMKRRAFGES